MDVRMTYSDKNMKKVSTSFDSKCCRFRSRDGRFKKRDIIPLESLVEVDFSRYSPSPSIENIENKDNRHDKGYKCKQRVISKEGKNLYKTFYYSKDNSDCSNKFDHIGIYYDCNCDRYRLSLNGRFISNSDDKRIVRQLVNKSDNEERLVYGYYDSVCRRFRSRDGKFTRGSFTRTCKRGRDEIFSQAKRIDSRILEEKNQARVGEEFPVIDFYSKEPEYIVFEISIDRLLHIMSRDKESIWLLSVSDRMVLVDELRELFGERIKLSFNIRTGDICLMGYNHNDVLWYKIDEILNKDRGGRV